MKRLVLSLLLGLLLTASCTQQLEEPTIQTFTGEELFGSIFFLQGNAVNKISHLKSMKDEIDLSTAGDLKEALSTVKNDIIDIISKSDASFFSRFQSDVQSGNHLKIENAIKYGLAELQEASKLLYEIQIDELVEEIQTLNEEELKAYFSEENLEEVNNLKTTPDLLKKYLLNDFLTQANFDHSGARQACLVLGPFIAVGAVLYVAAAGAFDIALSMNVVMAMNFAIASYTYVVSTGDTGETWMFFNAGVISGEEEIQNERVGKSSLSLEVFINEIAEKLNNHAS